MMGAEMWWMPLAMLVPLATLVVLAGAVGYLLGREAKRGEPPSEPTEPDEGRR